MKPNGVQVIERSVSLLRAVAHYQSDGARLTQLSDDLDLPHPTVYRMLSALVSHRMIVRNQSTRRYTIGPLCFELSLASNEPATIVSRYRPYLDKLASATGDSVYMMMRSGHDAVCVARVEAQSPIRTVPLNVGDWRPLGVGAAAIAILASINTIESDLIISQNAPFYERYGTSCAMVALRVHEARACGFGLVLDSPVPGISALGVAVKTKGRHSPYLGVSVASISAGFTEQAESKKKLLSEAAAAMIKV